jgi:hypothetical protein
VSWITLTVADVARKLTGPELEACRTAAIEAAQPDPVPLLIEDAVGKIRGYCATCSRNKLGPANTIPERLVDTALVLIRWSALNRMPDVGLTTEARRTEYTDAISLLKEVAACDFTIEAPDSPAGEENSPPPPSPHIIPRPLHRQMADSNGL